MSSPLDTSLSVNKALGFTNPETSWPRLRLNGTPVIVGVILTGNAAARSFSSGWIVSRCRVCTSKLSF